MSFSGEIKNELSRQVSIARHCQIAEIAALLSMNGKITSAADGKHQIILHTENISVARKYFTLAKKTFSISVDISVQRSKCFKKNTVYLMSVKNQDEVVKLLQAVKWMDSQANIKYREDLVSHLVIQNACCKRAFIRGAFLAAGSISAPEKFYHFEIVCLTEKKAEQLKFLIRSFSIDAKIVQRKKYFVVYIKEGAQIVEILNVMEAHNALMALENVRIVKEMRNSVNRQVNCETANINKTISAAVKQIEDIQLIQECMGFPKLPSPLAEMAEVRLENPDASLKELGELLSPQVGKSGVNHRLRKLGNIADKLRETQGGKL